MKWARRVACVGEVGSVYDTLVWEPEGKTLLGRPACRWEN